MHHQGVRDFQAMTNLGKGLRDRLESCAEITPPQIESQQDSADGTRKWAIKVDGGALVEAVLIPEGIAQHSASRLRSVVASIASSALR